MQGHQGTLDSSADRFRAPQGQREPSKKQILMLETPKQEPLKEDHYLQTSAMSAFKAKRGCNCQKSRCIKLYCECYANGVYCSDCNCVDCLNNGKNEDSRKNAIKSTLEKNPAAFQPKITSNQLEMKNTDAITARHNKGCACRKSHCLKKYCECYQAGIPCTALCKCIDCHNINEHNHALARAEEGLVNSLFTQQNLVGSRYQMVLQAKQRPSQNLYKILLPSDEIYDKLDQDDKISKELTKVLKSDLGELAASHDNHLISFSDSLEAATPRKPGLFDRSAQKPSSAAKLLISSEISESMLKKRSPTHVVDNLACDEDLSPDQLPHQSRAEAEGENLKQNMDGTGKPDAGKVVVVDPDRIKTPVKDKQDAEHEVTEFQIRKFLMLKGFLAHLRQITDTLGSKLPEQTSKVA